MKLTYAHLWRDKAHLNEEICQLGPLLAASGQSIQLADNPLKVELSYIYCQRLHLLPTFSLSYSSVLLVVFSFSSSITCSDDDANQNWGGGSDPCQVFFGELDIVYRVPQKVMIHLSPKSDPLLVRNSFEPLGTHSGVKSIFTIKGLKLNQFYPD